MFTLTRGTAVTTGHTTTDADTGFLSEFQRLQRLVADVLRVHPLSGAIEYESNAPLRVNASRWWEELQLQSEAATTQRTSRKRRLRHADARRDSNAHVPQPTVLSTDVRSVETRRKWMSQDAQERLVETLVRILHSLSVWTHELEQKATGHDEKAGVLQHIEDAIGAVGVLVLREWSARDDAEAVATHVVNVLLQFHTEVGAFHPFHQHKLSASTAQRIFRTKPRWSCSRCERTWETHGPPEPILVFRCTACEFTICRECYTRVPNAAPELKELEMDREPFTSLQGISVQHFLPLILDRLRLADASAYAALAPKLALAARERLQELLLYRSQEMVPTMQMIVDLYSTPGFARLFIEKEPLQWLPLYISSAKMRLYSFLGTLMGWTSMSDEPGEINLTPEGRRDVSSTALTLQWLDGYRTLRQMLSCLFVTLLDSETQDAFVIDAMLTYLATMITCFAATRSSSQSTDDLHDGILVNLSSALTHIASPILDKKRHLVTTLYHESFLPRRVYFDRAEPLRKNRGYNEQVAREADDARVAQMDADNIDKAKTTTNEGHTHYYPHSEKHFGVLCDNCDAADFEGPRYKCAFCEDVDICGKCYGEFVAQPLPTATQSEASILREAHIHRADHVLLRLSVPVPMIAARHFIPNEYRKPQLLYESDASTDVGTVLALKCSECDLALEPFDVYFKCSNCVNPRLVCPTCLENEEKHKDPSRAHVPGHLYFAIPREWRRLYNPLSRELFFRGLFYPPCIYPRERLSMETEIVYMTIKTLHIGPLHSLSRLLGVVKEMYELRSFCACEEQRVEFERRHQPRTARRVPKLSAHYSASQARLADLGATRLMAEMHLLETANVIDWIAFYSKTCRWLLELASPSQNPFKTILTDFSDAFSTFPEHFFVDLCDVMTMLTVDSIHDSNNVGRGGADKNALNEDAVAFVEPLLIMLVQLMATRKCTKNPHLRVQAAKALSAVMSFFMQDNKLAAVLRKVFQRCKLLRDYAVRAVLQFHEDMEGYHLRNNGLVFNSNTGSGDHLLWGFLSIRVTTVMLLRVMWQFADQRADLVRVFQSKVRGHTGSEIDLGADMETPVGNQVSVLIMGLWSDAAKLLEEGNAKVSVLTQLADVREALLEGRQIQLPFRPSMLEGYIALHSKHLRVSMRMLVEVLELLSWIADNTALKRAMLKPELADQCARTTSFMISSVMTAYKSNALSFTWHHPQDNKRVFAHLVLLVVRCAGRGSTESSPVGGADLTTACSPSQFWSLAQGCGTSMLRFVGDVEAHSRWELNRSIIRMESARYLGGDTGEEEFDEDTSEPELTRRQMQSDWRAEPVPREEEQNGFDFSEELDENAALALLEQQSSQTLTTLSTHAVATSSSSQQVVKGQRVVARQLGNRFVSALAKDGRFDAEAFLAGCELLKLPSSEKMEASEFELVGSAWMALYQQVLHRCQDVVKLQLAMDELLVDIPEEYLDPLLSTIMTDPVRLPSGNVVDRAVIERHLLSSNRVDPFTREPLTTEMLVPCDTLRREIQMYLRSKLHHLVHKKDDVLATWGLAWDCIFDVGADTK